MLGEFEGHQTAQELSQLEYWANAAALYYFFSVKVLALHWADVALALDAWANIRIWSALSPFPLEIPTAFALSFGCCTEITYCLCPGLLPVPSAICLASCYYGIFPGLLVLLL